MKKSTAVAVIAVLTAAALGLGIFALTGRGALGRAEGVCDLYGEKALGELAASMSSMAESMEKSLYATDTAHMAELCARAAANASSALSAFGMLPYSTHELEGLLGYINTAGDYALFLCRQSAAGALPDGEQSRALRDLSGTVTALSQELIRILQQLQEGAVDMDDYGDGADDDGVDTVGYELRRIEEELPELPPLEYDGAYSSTNKKPAAMTENAEPVTEEQARRIAARFLGEAYDSLSSQGRTDAELPCWQFGYQAGEGDLRLICVTEAGGLVSSLSSSRQSAEGDTSGDDAAGIAESFLLDHGYRSMAEAEREEKDGLTVTTWVYVEEGVYCLPDAVSVVVANDTGEVTGFEAGEYILNHRERTELTPGIDRDRAAEAVSKDLTPQAARLVIRETDGGGEKLYWEIGCKTANNAEVSVFVDAFTGKEGKIEIEQA